jgi:sugar/nucleoside kinase (ribokinase family)
MSSGTLRRWDLLSAGDIFVDLVLTDFPHWPQPGEEVFARRMARELGGGCAITAAGAAALGVRVGLLACVGREERDWVARKLQQRGIDGSCLQIDEDEPTALTVSVSSPEERALFSYDGANRGMPALLDRPATRALLGDARHLHLACGLEPERLAELAAAARAAGATLSLVLGWKEAWLHDPAALRVLRDVDLFMPNQHEAECLTGQREPEAALRWLEQQGLTRVVLKLGGRGAALLWEGEILWQAPHPVEAIDTTGAGDAFDAGFLAGWLQRHAPARCLRQAAICGALSTRALGGLGGLAGSDELAAALEAPAPATAASPHRGPS